MKKVLFFLLAFTSSAFGQYTQMQWGMDKTVSPYAFALNINGTWRNMGTVTPTGEYTLALGNQVFPNVNNISQQIEFYTTTGTQLGVYQGSPGTPSTVQNPPVFVQRYLRANMAGEYDQTVGTMFLDTEIVGSGTVTPNKGAYTGALFSTNAINTNQGTTLSPNFDYLGDVIGLAGFASNPGVSMNHITAGIWAWAKGPTLDDTTYNNLPAGNFTTTGLEINLSYNHKDPTTVTGITPYITGKGASVGLFESNYRDPGTGVKDWTFGQVISGTPETGNYLDTDPNNWNGVHTGILIDHVKDVGLQFGGFVNAGKVLIGAPGFWNAGAADPNITFASLQNSKINMGNFTGATFVEHDLWMNTVAGCKSCLYTNDGVDNFHALTENLTGIGQVKGTVLFVNTDKKVTFSIDGGWSMVLNGVVNAVNYFDFTNATFGGTPAFAVLGPDPNIGINILPKGTGTVTVTRLAVPQSATFASGATFTNATSGSITLQPPAGALGTVTATLPANTGTIAETNLAQTWTATQTFDATIKLKAYTVGGLPTCNAGAEGSMAYVTDANAPAYNVALVGGGTVKVPAFCNGAAWTAH